MPNKIRQILGDKSAAPKFIKPHTSKCTGFPTPQHMHPAANTFHACHTSFRKTVLLGGQLEQISLVPRLFPPPVFDRLQYANTEGGFGHVHLRQVDRG